MNNIYGPNGPNRHISNILTTAEYTFFSSIHGTLSRIDHMLGHTTSLSRFKIEVIPSIFSDHSVMKLELSYMTKTGK